MCVKGAWCDPNFAFQKVIIFIFYHLLSKEQITDRTTSRAVKSFQELLFSRMCYFWKGEENVISKASSGAYFFNELPTQLLTIITICLKSDL